MRWWRLLARGDFVLVEGLCFARLLLGVTCGLLFLLLQVGPNGLYHPVRPIVDSMVSQVRPMVAVGSLVGADEGDDGRLQFQWQTICLFRFVVCTEDGLGVRLAFVSRGPNLRVGRIILYYFFVSFCVPFRLGFAYFRRITEVVFM